MKIIKAIAITAFIMLSISNLQAQPTPGGDPTGGTDQPIGAAGAPIDGGLSVLLAAGVAFGAKKLYNKKKAENL